MAFMKSSSACGTSTILVVPFSCIVRTRMLGWRLTG